MRRTICLAIEVLEGKALLAAGAAVAPGLVDSLTAVASRTTSGAIVVESFTVTNVSGHDIQVARGPVDDGFAVTRGGKAVFDPDEGILPRFLEVDDLKPRQSLTIRGTWDARSDLAGPGAEGPLLSGRFAITNGLDIGGASASVTIPRSWAGPVKVAKVAPQEPTPLVPATVQPTPSSPARSTALDPSSS